MFKLFSKGSLSTLLALLSISAMNSSLMASDCCDPCCDGNRFYIGAFGGGIYAGSGTITQRGTVFFLEEDGGPLAVNAQGSSNRNSAGFGGVQLGYEWGQCPTYCGCSDWSLVPAAELEAYFYGHNLQGTLINPTDRLPEHNFDDSFHTTRSVILVNGVLNFNSPCACGISPYVGGGLGATHISLSKANSFQVAPAEVGVNHFSSRSDSAWAFAAQVKAGLGYKICESFHIFGEYRYLFVGSNNYIFGSTVAVDHVPTSPWNVKVNSINYNAFAFGIRYDL